MASPCGLGSLTAWHLGSENEYYKKQEAEAAGPLTDQAWNRPCITLSHPITEAAMGPAQIPGEGKKKSTSQKQMTKNLHSSLISHTKWSKWKRKQTLF